MAGVDDPESKQSATPEIGGAPVGESAAEYGAWARSWAAVRRRAKIRVFVATGLAVAAVVILGVAAPTMSLHARARDVDAAVDTVAPCCHAYGREWPGSCGNRLPKAAATISYAPSPPVAFLAVAFESVLPDVVPRDDHGELRRKVWSLCPELAVFVEGAQGFDGPTFQAAMEQAFASPDDVIRANARELRRHTGH